MNSSHIPGAQQRTFAILQDLEAVRENLLGLSDDIWQSIDHNDPEALSEGFAFKQEFNAKAADFDRTASELSEMIQGYTTIRLDAAEEAGNESGEQNERMIAELNRGEPHSIEEDFTFKRPFGFVFRGQAITGVTTWQRMYQLICRQLSEGAPEQFRSLFDHPDFISRRGHRTFQESPDGMRKALKIRDGVFAEANLSTNGIRDVIQRTLAALNVPQTELINGVSTARPRCGASERRTSGFRQRLSSVIPIAVLFRPPCLSRKTYRDRSGSPSFPHICFSVSRNFRGGASSCRAADLCSGPAESFVCAISSSAGRESLASARRHSF